MALRFLHSAIHMTSNRVLWRFRVFAASWFVLLAYWTALGAALVTAGSAPVPTG